VAEHTMGLILSMSRRIHLSRDRVMGRVPSGTSLRGWEFRNKTLGIIGLGRIGSRVAEISRGFDVELIGYDHRSKEEELVERVGRQHLLNQSDIISLHIPLEDTYELNESDITAMKDSALLINVSRPELVNENTVIKQIRSDKLFGYALDGKINAREQANDLIEEGRIFETGHTAWYSNEVLDRGYNCFIDNLIEMKKEQCGNLVTDSPRQKKH
ncbi:MAG: 2-hydroxyacid dehydrogenase, partial [bacterium]